MIGPIGPGDFVADDFLVLEGLELSKRVYPVVEALHDIVESFENYDR
jgi:UDP-glucose:glycoprotein glucosyltransferase